MRFIFIPLSPSFILTHALTCDMMMTFIFVLVRINRGLSSAGNANNNNNNNRRRPTSGGRGGRGRRNAGRGGASGGRGGGRKAPVSGEDLDKELDTCMINWSFYRFFSYLLSLSDYRFTLLLLFRLVYSW
jgi:hypothetical protein